MEKNFNEANIAFSVGEVPVGCVFVKDGVIQAEAHNETTKRANVRTLFYCGSTSLTQFSV